jgi:hypothetical protein
MPKPVLQAMVLADHVYQDRLTGKFIICGTFSTILFGPSPNTEPSAASQNVAAGLVSRAGSPYLYLALAEVHGDVQLSLRFVDLSDASVLIQAEIIVASNDPVAVAEYILPMPPLPAERIGNYSLDLLYDEELLGSWRIAVRPLGKMQGEGSVE